GLGRFLSDMKHLLLVPGALLALAAARPVAPTPPALPTTAAELPAVRQAQFKKDTFSLRQYGAVADGQTLNTDAFQKAITACAAKGGGT
nr:hypothetical protein [Tanacetum cinerariifolium]